MRSGPYGPVGARAHGSCTLRASHDPFSPRRRRGLAIPSLLFVVDKFPATSITSLLLLLGRLSSARCPFHHPAMDALSTAPSALGVGCFLSAPPPPSREPHLFRPPSFTSLAPPQPARSHHLSRSRHPHLPQPLGVSPAARPLRPLPFPSNPSRCSPRRRTAAAAPAPFHRRASTGYAAALLDVARCEGAVEAVERDVRRFSWAVQALLADPHVGEGRKAEAVRRTLEGGGFGRHLVALVRMLVGKGKVGMVGEVMEEFGRVYDELTGTRAVLVSSARKMGVEQLAGIAERVRLASGAAKVRVRHAYTCS
ncbi:hypothetical protein Taro_025248 [Colocasia esculenta]|uniref:ATP synthase delta chain, chloroplastic n=1 Tax=Colocasia esculenta TaxID=4460 RepID=A0A843V8X4_COLES|nr:hypothetical protein [Colocasia esculenta]